METVAGWVKLGKILWWEGRRGGGLKGGGLRGHKIVVIKDKNNTQGAVNGLLNTGWARVEQ